RTRSRPPLPRRARARAGRRWSTRSGRRARPSRSRSAPLRQHRSPASGRPAAARVLLLQLARVAAIDDQTVVVVELLARLDVAQRLDEDAAVVGLVGLAVGSARVVDPLRRVAAGAAVDDVLVVDVEEERVVGIVGVFRMTALRLFPGDDVAGVLDDRLAGGNRREGEHALAVDAGAAHLDAAAALNGRRRRRGLDKGLRWHRLLWVH